MGIFLIDFDLHREREQSGWRDHKRTEEKQRQFACRKGLKSMNTSDIYIVP